MPEILIVDDSKMLREMLRHALLDGGFEKITEAKDGKEALVLAKKKSFDLVITDINMPNMNGFELITSLRKISNYQKTPLLVLTTEKSEAMKIKGQSSGATGWIVKPFLTDKLIKAIKIALKR